MFFFGNRFDLLRKHVEIGTADGDELFFCDVSLSFERTDVRFLIIAGEQHGIEVVEAEEAVRRRVVRHVEHVRIVTYVFAALELIHVEAGRRHQNDACA